MGSRLSDRVAVLERKARAKAIGLTEAHVQQTIVEFLQIDGWRAIRTELTVQRDRGRVVGERGMPDMLLIRYEYEHPFPAPNPPWPEIEPETRSYAQVLWIEMKKPGEKPRKDQLAWHEAERARGALVLVVDDIDEGIARYKASGLWRRR